MVSPETFEGREYPKIARLTPIEIHASVSSNWTRNLTALIDEFLTIGNETETDHCPDRRRRKPDPDHSFAACGSGFREAVHGFKGLRHGRHRSSGVEQPLL
jgi:hypothetical protein